MRSEWVFDQAGVCVVRIAGKGEGVVATRAFVAGERICADPPITVVDAHTPHTAYDGIVRGLMPSAQAAFWTLDQAAKYGGTKTARGVWLTNGYPSTSRDGRKVRRAALTALTARAARRDPPCVAAPSRAFLAAAADLRGVRSRL